MLKKYSLIREPDTDTYIRLLDFLFDRCSTCSLVVRQTLPVDLNVDRFLNLAKPYLLRYEERSQWPGTELFDSTAQVFLLRTDPGLKMLMREETGSIYDWAQPELPEDPVFYRPDGTVMLSSIIHEGDVYLEVMEAELRDLYTSNPTLESYLIDDAVF